MFKKVLMFAFLVVQSFAITVIDNPSNGIINVNVSNKSVNRIVLPSKILDVAYSKEKGVDIQIVDNQAFIKFLPIQKEKVRITGRDKYETVGEPEIVYDKAQSSEVFFITETKTYSIGLNPKNIEAETIIINDFSSSKEKILKYETDDSYVATLAKITESIFKGGVPNGYKISKINTKVESNGVYDILELNEYQGVVFNANYFEIKNKTSKAMQLNPKDYIRFAKSSPKSISIYYDNEVNHLLPYAKVYMVIITKANR